jgi:hypothetical protein
MFDVLSGFVECVHVVIEHADSEITSSAKQAANPSRAMAMIQGENASFPFLDVLIARAKRVVRSADRTQSALARKYRVVLLLRETKVFQDIF